MIWRHWRGNTSMPYVRPEAEPPPAGLRAEKTIPVEGPLPAQCRLPERGIYLIWMQMTAGCRLTIGALGECRFPAGWYVYVGSAQRALPARLKRHLAMEKKHRWHIDYLRPHVVVVSCAVACLDRAAECLAARRLISIPEATVPVPGFGASDCRCPAHLIYFPILPPACREPALILPEFRQWSWV